MIKATDRVYHVNACGPCAIAGTVVSVYREPYYAGRTVARVIWDTKFDEVVAIEALILVSEAYHNR